jgi:hypothetical protein
MSYTKDPASTLDFAADWAAWLTARGSDTIASSVWVVPTGITSTAEAHTTTTATIWLSGGTLGQTYDVVNRVTTTAGRIEDHTLSIYITAH